MKYFTLIFCLTSLTVVSQINKQINGNAPLLISSGANSYRMTDSSVSKLDTAGNSIWVKNFRGHIMDTSIFQNRLGGIAFDGTYLYLQSIQGPPMHVTGTWFPANIVLDTNGNMINIRYQKIQSSTFGIRGCSPSIRSGAWYFEDYSPGFTHHARLYKIDSTGGWQPTEKLDFYFQSYTYIERFITLPDSTYLIMFYSFSTNPNDLPYPSLAKIRENGSIDWIKSYQISPNYASNKPLGIAADSVGNIYLIFGAFLNAPFAGMGLLKINSLGNVIANNNWLNFSVPLYGNSLVFENNMLTFCYGNKKLFFDSLLNNRCLPNDTTFIFIARNETYSSDPFYYDLPSAFVPTDDSAYHFITPTFTDYCNIVYVDETKINTNVSFFPNPASEKINISFHNDNFKTAIFTLYDIMGRIVIRNEIRDSDKINVSNVDSGIYVAEVFLGSSKIIRKIIIDK